MGRRALVAFERSDGWYDLWYVHWLPDSPFDHSDREPFQLATRAVSDRRIDPIEGAFVGSHPEPEPIAFGIPLRTALGEHLDPVVHETVIVVPLDKPPNPHVVVPLWLPGADPPDPPSAALVEPRDGSGVSEIADLRGWSRGIREATAEMVDRGALSPEQATAYLVDVFDRREAFFVPDDLP